MKTTLIKPMQTIIERQQEGNFLVLMPLPSIRQTNNEKYTNCIFCQCSFPESKMVPIRFIKHYVEVCPSCNDDLRTCAICGVKVLKNQPFTRGVKGEYFHNDCV